MKDLTGKLRQLEIRFARAEPIVKAFLPEERRFERLHREAGELQKRWPDPAGRPPLFGALLGVKDIYHVDGFETHAGSKLPAGELGGVEAVSVTQLKNAGALIVGKTVTTEFAYFAPGPTRNPRNPDHTPGGSSSGSAAAVAACLCEIALGTQTIGSVNRPAAFCGVSGYKPSYDRISRAGIIPLSGSLDHAGLFAERLPLLERAAGILAGGWNPAGVVERPVLGVPTGPYLDRTEPEGLDQFRRGLAILEKAGFVVREIPALADFDLVYERHQRILAAEAARVHARWFARHADLYHEKTKDLILKGQAIDDRSLNEDLGAIPEFREGLTGLMEDRGIDAWITPSAPGPAPSGLESTGNPVMNLPWTQAGLPTLTIPCGVNDEGLPFGLQLVGGWFADEMLFARGILVEEAVLSYNQAQSTSI